MVLLDFLCWVESDSWTDCVAGERRTLFGASSRPFVGGLCITKFF